jgi:hypothetical protein
MWSRTRTMSEVFFIGCAHAKGRGRWRGAFQLRIMTTYIYVIFVLLQAYVNYFSPSSNLKPIYLMLGQK